MGVLPRYTNKVFMKLPNEISTYTQFIDWFDVNDPEEIEISGDSVLIKFLSGDILWPHQPAQDMKWTNYHGIPIKYL